MSTLDNGGNDDPICAAIDAAEEVRDPLEGLVETIAADAGAAFAPNALGAHARDELPLSEMTAARPVQAALTSAATFAAGASLPMLTVAMVPERMIAVAVAVASLVFLALLGAIGAAAGGAGVPKAVVRVTFWGALAMAITAGIGRLFGTAL